MLKKRIIGIITTKDGIVVQSINFDRYLPVGDVGISIEAFCDWEIDEIILLDIGASKKNNTPFEKIDLEKVLYKSSVPVSIGGGICDIETVKSFFEMGVEKIVVGSCVNEMFLKEVSDMFGSQSIIISIDVKKIKEDYIVFIDSATKSTKKSLKEYIEFLDNYSYAEVLIHSIDNDGKKNGYDIELVNYIKTMTSKPIIAAGGAKNSSSIYELFSKTDISAAAAGNFFHFSEHSVLNVKKDLLANGISVREVIC